jgi:hypothetical protein
VRLPAGYIADSVELAYATTAHRAQGATVDTAHTLVTDETTRESLYVASTRGRLRNIWYAAVEELLDADGEHAPEAPRSGADLLAGVLARTSADPAATTAIRGTQREATSLPTLVARYRHAWDSAALDVLRGAAAQLPPDLGRRLLADPASRHLAQTLASSTAGGANATSTLQAAVSYGDLSGARSPALVVASRIADIPHTLGIIDNARSQPPLPWLPAPVVGHAEWDDYLAARAALISSRVAVLGSLGAAYREQYRLTHLSSGDLGQPPDRGTTQHAAYRYALSEKAARGSSPTRQRAQTTSASLAPDRPSRGHHLTL